MKEAIATLRSFVNECGNAVTNNRLGTWLRGVGVPKRLIRFGGRGWVRTSDPCRVKAVLSH